MRGTKKWERTFDQSNQIADREVVALRHGDCVVVSVSSVFKLLRGGYVFLNEAWRRREDCVPPSTAAALFHAMTLQGPGVVEALHSREDHHKTSCDMMGRFADVHVVVFALARAVVFVWCLLVSLSSSSQMPS